MSLANRKIISCGVHTPRTKIQQKTLYWPGKNKEKSRKHKRRWITIAQTLKFLSANPHALTFAGAPAIFERALVRQGITTPENIVTVQTYRQVGAHSGDPILRELIETRDEYLRHMYIWPYSFHSFLENCHLGKIHIPDIKSTAPKWFRDPLFYREMKRFLRRAATPFSIIDLDFCGVFSHNKGLDITRMLAQNGAERGLLFVNHQKGRDGNNGRLFKFLREYFRHCPYFDIDNLTDKHGNQLNIDYEDTLSFSFVRYILTPVYHICEAFNAGYRLEVDELVEYRDSGAHQGVVMLQWCFNFEKLKSPTLQGAVFQNVFARERERLQEHLQFIREEAYLHPLFIEQT